MSAIGTILTTAAIGIGAVAAVKHLKKRFAEAETLVNDIKARATGRQEDVLEYEKNPETGVFEPKK
jgi:hypothetical protein